MHPISDELRPFPDWYRIVWVLWHIHTCTHAHTHTVILYAYTHSRKKFWVFVRCIPSWPAQINCTNWSRIRSKHIKGSKEHLFILVLFGWAVVFLPSALKNRNFLMQNYISTMERTWSYCAHTLTVPTVHIHKNCPAIHIPHQLTIRMLAHCPTEHIHHHTVCTQQSPRHYRHSSNRNQISIFHKSVLNQCCVTLKKKRLILEILLAFSIIFFKLFFLAVCVFGSVGLVGV